MTVAAQPDPAKRSTTQSGDTPARVSLPEITEQSPADVIARTAAAGWGPLDYSTGISRREAEGEPDEDDVDLAERILVALAAAGYVVVPKTQWVWGVRDPEWADNIPTATIDDSDGGTEDFTEETARAFVARYPRFRLVRVLLGGWEWEIAP